MPRILKKNTSSSLKGASSYENFRAFADSKPLIMICEVPLYSDAYFTDEYRSSNGPFSLLNPLRTDEGRIGPAIILRCEMREFYDFPRSTPYQSDLTKFTGTSLYDELACLLSLQFGTRLLAGGETRRFDGRDEFGIPQADPDSPTILLSAGRRRRTLLPWVATSKAIFPGLLPRLRLLAPKEALTLIRAARQYRDAIWIADEDPQLAWLLLVGAAEVIALHDKLATKSPIDLLRDSAPELVEIIGKSGTDILADLAPHLAPLFKSTARFLGLFAKYPPLPPPQRPPEGFQFKDWNENLPTALAKIYNWRSRSLHDGIAFPLPMCESPHHVSETPDAPSETVPGLAASALGGVWTKDEMPFGLHLFEYLVRTTILNWWSTRLGNEAKDA